MNHIILAKKSYESHRPATSLIRRNRIGKEKMLGGFYVKRGYTPWLLAAAHVPLYVQVIHQSAPIV
jgi:hypothetical protein